MQIFADTRVINVTPIPTCAPLFDLCQKTLDGLQNNAPERFPIQGFKQGDVRLSPAGTEHYSEEAAQHILNGLTISAK